MSAAKSKTTDEARYTVLAKLSQIGTPMNMLEIGFSATPHVIRNMAARGLVRVTVEVTSRGLEHFDKERLKRLRKATKERHESMAQKVFGT